MNEKEQVIHEVYNIQYTELSKSFQTARYCEKYTSVQEKIEPFFSIHPSLVYYESFFKSTKPLKI